ncbi:SKO1 [Candida pseudojiufengensis]|uniref:SKO1 n=1 Tax=Candida pseudojiufengensis TaxID=497109 RepID=UPI002223F890|nr:SKO1 [Candida pseudojiufengensis]KAI5961269.1 SKO1 [Candida pseudojiufengensis]
MSSDSRSKFELEPNPFERSFATKESSLSISTTTGQQSRNESSSEIETTGNSSHHSNQIINNNHVDSISKHSNPSSFVNLQQASQNQQQQPIIPPSQQQIIQVPTSTNNSNGQQQKLPGITPPLFTPGGRRLPPLDQTSNPGTPTTNLWNSLINVSNNQQQPSHVPPPPSSNHLPHQQNQQQQQNYNQFISSMRKTGLTPNESNLRSGLTPGGFNFGVVPGLSTPGALLNGPITPGLSSLLGLSSGSNSLMMNLNNNGIHNQALPLSQPQSQPQMQPQPQLQQQPQPQPAQSIPDSQPQIPYQHPPAQPHVQSSSNHSMYSTHESPTIPQQSQPSENQPKPAIPNSKTQSPNHEDITNKTKSEENGTSEKPTRKRKNTGTKQSTTTKKPRAPKVKKSKSSTETTANEPPQNETEKENSKDNENNDKNGDSNSKDEKPKLNKRKSSNDEEKRKNFLERNRVAASKCRQRKKQLIQKMEDELSFYSNGYRESSAQVAQLRSQLINIKNILVAHKSCPSLAQYCGGFDNLTNIIQEANFATEATESAQQNISSIPSTIPTTLNQI